MAHFQLPAEMIDRFTICEHIDDCLGQLAFDGHLAVITSRKHALANHRIPNWLIYCFEDRDRILGYPVSMFMPDRHALQQTFNHQIQLAVETGLYVKWTDDNRSPFERISPQQKHKILRSQLTVEHIFTGLALYIVFVTFSVGAFVAEHIVKRFVRRRNAGRFWKIAEMLIDGDRHFMLPKKLLPLRRRNIHQIPQRWKLKRIK